MKKIATFIFIAVLYLNYFSVVARNEITENQKIGTIGKIYGFLKYYHPAVASGQFNWDQELIKRLPQLKSTKSKAALSEFYINWIDELGEVKKCRKCKPVEKVFDENYNLSWLDDSNLFTNTLIEKLNYIKRNRFQGKHFYAEAEPVGKIKPINEPKYESFDYPDEAYRLLGLFKYWNIIEYFFPYKYLTDQKWDAVLLEMIPKMINVSDKKEYQLAIRELVAKTDDTHAWVMFGDANVKYIPVKISDIENQAVVSGFFNDSLANLNGLKLGDIILKIDDVNVREEAEVRQKYVAGSNSNIKVKNTYYRILMSGSDTIVNLTIKRGQDIKEMQVNRYDFNSFGYHNNPKTIKSKIIDGDIGYMNMKNIKGADLEKIFNSFEGKKAIIIDLRNYPAFVHKYVSRYLNSERRDFAKPYSPTLEYPGKFFYKNKYNLRVGVKNKDSFKGKVFILVNDESMSLSEFTAMAFQTADNVTTIGNQTAGADGNVTIFEYLGGFKTAMSGIGILYPDGSETQRVGVKIDIEVKPSVAGLRQNRDEILEKAIELAKE